MRSRGLPFVLLLLCIASPAAAHDDQFMTLERADHHSKLGLQASLQFYPDVDDVFGLRPELYGQAVGRLRGGGALGGYGHVALGALIGEPDELAIFAIELGGLYVAPLGRRSDLVVHLGVTLPTASTGVGDGLARALTGLERNYDLVNAGAETTALNLGVTLHTLLGRSAFLQGDLALDLEIDAPGDNDAIFHANLGLGAYVGGLVVMGELATLFADETSMGSLGLGLRFRSPLHPHIGYVLAFVDDDAGVGDGVVAHILSVGFYATFD